MIDKKIMDKGKIWETIMSQPSLTEGEIHVWKVFLDWPIEEIEKGVVGLTEEEKTRARRLVNQQHRCYYIASHIALHAILALYLPLTPRPLRFRRNNCGKPYLLENSSLYFNLSHSHTVALYIIAVNREVGIDVELIRNRAYIVNVKRRFFPNVTKDCACSHRFSKWDNKCLKNFYHIWTFKEAYAKLTGQSLWFLKLFTKNINIDAESKFFIDFDSGNLCISKKRWMVCSVPTSKLGYIAALATENPVKKIRYFAWSPVFSK
ncbi:4'-phosphopantetheinyl transferase family protein [Coxiella endosymbiont of Amblyomma americanum]|uniref:4'-phosphopantetheinyl transferase family protein n=1 Tax=Coxiella endosymbiont of Amblyomma americanum TaxID=325775 RepID=UPI00057D7716|nr:4'-phosphopantetheinyl transferase superfamily protein [Coxiella endosymbiont of Amblyomma americanum]AJC50407.1 Phosphopantetheinyl transferase [Coxiella endosymbiont of Amblyomma americanum]